MKRVIYFTLVALLFSACAQQPVASSIKSEQTLNENSNLEKKLVNERMKRRSIATSEKVSTDNATVATIQTDEQRLQEEVEKLVVANDLNGLKDYTEKNPNAVYYIKDEWLRLALTGPKGMKVGDIREYLKGGKSEKILIAMIKQQELPYKKFSMSEVDMLIKMQLSEDVITAMIDVTTKLLDNEKIAKQQQFFLDEQKRVSTQTTAAIYQNSAVQENSVTNKVGNEVIKQGVGILLDQLFHR